MKIKKVLSVVLSAVICLQMLFVPTFAAQKKYTVISYEKGMEELEQDKFTKDMTAIFKNAVKVSKVDSENIGVYVKDLKSGSWYGYHHYDHVYDSTTKTNDGSFTAASVVKLPETFAIYKMAEKGIVDLDKKKKDPVTGREVTLRKEIGRALKNSNNDSFNTMLRLVGNKAINSELKDIDLHHTFVFAEIRPGSGVTTEGNIKRHGSSKGGRITPLEAGIILENVYRQTKEGNPYMKEMNKNLLGNVYHDRIPDSLNRSTHKVAHKTGTIPGTFNDAGIVYGEKDYIIVVFSENQSKSKMTSFYRNFVKSTDKYIDQLK